MTAAGQDRALRYVEGFGLRPRAAGLDVVGGKRTVRLKGADVSAATLRVVDLLRAGHPLDSVAERLDLPVDAVRARIAPLVCLGVLTYATEPHVNAPAQMVRFFERTIGVDAAAIALDRLARATVQIDADEQVRRMMGERLRACGVGTLAGTADLPWLVICCDPVPPSVLCAASAGDVPTLYVALGPNQARVGPLCDVPGGRCRRCLDMPGQPSPEGVADPVSVRLGVALAVSETVLFLSGTGYCRTSGGAVWISEHGRQQGFQPLVRDPGCAWCGLPGVSLADTSIHGYRSLQAADVPLKPNWSRPIQPVEVPDADSTIRVLAMPAGQPATRNRLEHGGALDVVCAVFAPRSRHRLPSVGGARLLNVFVCGATEDTSVACYLDRRSGSIRPFPAHGLARGNLVSADHLSVVVSATLSRAENLFGARANLTIYQDTGFALSVLETALADNGFASLRRRALAGQADEFVRVLGLQPGRDIVTAVVDVQPARHAGGAHPRRCAARRSPVAYPSLRREDLDVVLGSVTGDDVEALVRCYRVDGMPDGLFRVTRESVGVGLDRASETSVDVDAALDERGMDLAALVVFTTDIGHALGSRDALGIDAYVIDQACSAARVHHAARDRGLDAVLFADLPSTAVAPDARGWRSAYRSFAAVGLAARGTVDGAGGSAVRW
jgi:hypothetical protein